MDKISSKEYWQHIYTTRDEEELSWFEPTPSISLDLLMAPSLKKNAHILDVGGGTSRLADALLDHGFTQLSVLDIAEAAIEKSKLRLANRADQVCWTVADITAWEPDRKYAAWHDRAVFHFLTTEQQRAAYCAAMEKALLPGGLVVIGTFSTLGPDQCSGLPVRKYSAKDLSEELGDAFHWTATRKIEHITPDGQVQHFQFSRFVRD